MGFAEISRMDNTDPGNKDNLDEIINASGHLLKLLDELLDTTRLETGAFSIQLEKTELSKIIQNSVSLVGHLAAEHSIQIDHSNAEQNVGSVFWVELPIVKRASDSQIQEHVR